MQRHQGEVTSSAPPFSHRRSITQTAARPRWHLLDALVRSALILILHDTADQLVILLQELKGGRSVGCHQVGAPRADADLTQLPSLPHIQVVSTAVRPLQETPAPGPLLGDAHPLDGLLVDLSLAAKPVRGEDDRHAASKLGIPSREQLRRELLTSRATDAS